MWRILAVVVAALALSACGDEWAGSYSGQILEEAVCSDGSRISQSETLTMALREESGMVSWNAACGAVAWARVNGDAATVSTYTCPSFSNEGYTFRTSVTGGTLRLTDEGLSVDLTNEIGYTGLETGTCLGRLTGNMVRQN